MSAAVEDFYNKSHDPKSGRFTFKAKGGRLMGKIKQSKDDKAKVNKMLYDHEQRVESATKRAKGQGIDPKRQMVPLQFSFMSPLVEEFYNSCHGKDGRFCSARRGKAPKGGKLVPMSDAARRSNAILRSTAAARRSKEYKTALARSRGSWADREKSQGGLRSVKGANSKKADAARASNAKVGAVTKKWNNDPQLAEIKKKFG